MNRASLWRVSVTNCAGAEDQIAEQLGDYFGTAPAVYTDAKTGATEVFVFLEQKPAPKEISALETGLCEISTATPPAIRINRIKREDWAESWKKHFPPLRIGRALLIKPSWDKTRPAPGQVTVVLDPGLSFGTGQHPTTGFCLRQIMHFHLCGGGSFLDLGTGSGILAIAAARLGFPAVEAIDNDADAIRVARANARLNGVAERIRFKEADLSKMPTTGGQKFDMVCANLTHDLLVSQQARIVSRLRPQGWLVLAGILTEQFADVRSAYERAGFRLRRTSLRGEWQSGLFVR
jgi:ribosomal protein L11 methyltransferase